MTPIQPALRIGTRASKLALAQTSLVRAAIQRAQPTIAVDIESMTTLGDRVLDRSLASLGGKALFVAEIETALRSGRIDLAVHSAKDVPADLPEDMAIIAYLPREDARDALIARRTPATLSSLPVGARVGTSSPRRMCQLRGLRPDLEVADIRGNVDTRLAKLARGEFDAIILAAAGLRRLGIPYVATDFIPIDVMVPCAGQGAIAIEICRDRAPTLIALLAQLNHEPTACAVRAERAFLTEVGGSCTTPLAAHARLRGAMLELSCMIGAVDGRSVSFSAAGSVDAPERIGVEAARRALADGGAELLGRLALPPLSHVPEM